MVFEGAYPKTPEEHNDYIAFLKRLARAVDFERYPKARRGPKKEKPKRHYDPEHPHVSVAKILFSRKIKETG